jgi:hypothetical protein
MLIIREYFQHGTVVPSSHPSQPLKTGASQEHNITKLVQALSTEDFSELI